MHDCLMGEKRRDADGSAASYSDHARTPKFSVVIPVYERSDSILPTLQSVRAQTFRDWECIVVDDGSSDGDRLRRVVDDLGDRRFRYVRRPNGGGGAARNTGVATAAGRYIAFLDSDDLFLPNKLQVLDVEVSSDQRAAYYSYCRVDRGGGAYWTRPDRPIGATEDPAEYLFVSNQFIPTPSLVLPAQTARAYPFDPSLKKGQDLDLIVRLGAAGVRFVMIEEALTVWTDRDEHQRTSRTKGHEAPTAWLEAAKPLLSYRAYHGYRATVLAYYQAPTRPLSAMWSLLDGGFRAGVPWKVVVRQALRCFLPRRAYRALVNHYIREVSRGSGFLLRRRSHHG